MAALAVLRVAAVEEVAEAHTVEVVAAARAVDLAPADSAEEAEARGA